MNKIDKLISVISSKVDIYESYLNEGATEREIKEEIIKEWEFTKKTYNEEDFDEGERKYHQKELLREKSVFSPERLPFAHDGSGQLLSIDYIPGPKGISGQIIYNPMGDSAPMSVVASDFDDFISFITVAIESGELAVADTREEYYEDEKDNAEVYFYTTWRDDWVEIGDRYNLKIGLKT